MFRDHESVFGLNVDDRVTVLGRHFEIVSQDIDRIILRAEDNIQQHRDFTYQEFRKQIAVGDISISASYYSLGQAKARDWSGLEDIVDIPAKCLPYMMDRLEIVTLFLAWEEEGRCTRSDASMTRILKAMYEEINSRESRHGSGGRRREVLDMPSPKTLRTWCNRFVESGKSILALKSGYHRSGRFEGRLNALILDLQDQFVQGYLSERRPSIVELHQDLEDAVDDLNVERKKEGRCELFAPSYSTFRKNVRLLGKFEVHAARYGLDAAYKKYRAIGAGLQTSYPGEITEFDAYQIELISLISPDLLADCTDDERAKFKKARIQVHAGIDHCTNMIVGIFISLTENADAAISCLRMVGEDKTPLAKAYGCESTWHQLTSTTLVRRDGGSAWKRADFRYAAAALYGGHQTTVKGIPWHRASIERYFRTIGQRLLSFYSGRTFGGIDERGDADPSKRATVTSVELIGGLIRWLVDIYHHTKQPGLKYGTPYNTWEKESRERRPSPPVDLHKRRIVFGTKLEKPIYNAGIELFKHRYTNDALMLHMNKCGVGTKVDVIVDEHELGFISVKLSDAWISVKNESLVGRSLKSLQVVDEALKAELGELYQLNAPMIRRAKEAIRQTSEEAILRARLTGVKSTSEKLAIAEKRLFIGYHTNVADTSKDLISSDIFTDLIPCTGPTLGDLGEGGSLDSDDQEKGSWS